MTRLCGGFFNEDCEDMVCRGRSNHGTLLIDDLIVIDRDDVGGGEVEGDFVSGARRDGGGGEGVHLRDFDIGGAFEFDDVLCGFAEVGGVEDTAWEGVWGSRFFEGDRFGADGDEGVSGVVGVEIGVEASGFDLEGGV